MKYKKCDVVFCTKTHQKNIMSFFELFLKVGVFFWSVVFGTISIAEKGILW